MRPVLTLVTAAASEPIELSDVKSHLRIDHSDDDAMLAAYITTAISLIDGPSGRLKRALMPQTWKQSQPCPNGAGVIWLELPPIGTVTSIEFINSADDVLTAAELTDFDVIEQNEGFKIIRPKLGKSWPTFNPSRPDALQVTFTTGYADAASVPEPIKSAIRLLVGHFYANREATTDYRLREIPIGVDALLEQFRTKWYA